MSFQTLPEYPSVSYYQQVLCKGHAHTQTLGGILLAVGYADCNNGNWPASGGLRDDQDTSRTDTDNFQRQ